MRSGQLKSAVSHESQSPKRELPEDEKPHLLRFGLFDLNIQTRELRKAGLRVRLQDQPFRVLAVLLERPGELISRDELKRRLWGEAEFGDFDQAINVAVKKLRDRKSTRLNSSHRCISYAVFCLKKKKTQNSD